MLNHIATQSSELQAYKCYHSISDFLESTEVFFTSSSQRLIGFLGWFWKTKTYFSSPHSYKGNWKHQIWKHQSSLNVRLRIHRAKKRWLWHLLIFIAYFLKRKCMWSEGVYAGEREGHTWQNQWCSNKPCENRWLHRSDCIWSFSQWPKGKAQAWGHTVLGTRASTKETAATGKSVETGSQLWKTNHKELSVSFVPELMKLIALKKDSWFLSQSHNFWKFTTGNET